MEYPSLIPRIVALFKKHIREFEYQAILNLAQPEMEHERSFMVNMDLEDFHIEAEYECTGEDEGEFISLSVTPDYEVEEGQCRWRLVIKPDSTDTWDSGTCEMSNLIELFPQYRKEIIDRYPHYLIDFGGEAFARMQSTIEFALEHDMDFKDSAQLTHRTNFMDI
jgi:hypothetical protein